MTYPNGRDYSHPGYPHVKRAEVYFDRGYSWIATVLDDSDTDRTEALIDRERWAGKEVPFPTHDEALAYALHEVGLTPTTNPEPMEAP